MTVRELIIRNIDGKNVTVPLDRDRITLGRSSANELCYPDDAGLSRQHLALTRLGDHWQVEDLGSKNGTVLNGKRIEKATPFKEGDRISAGHLTIEFAETALNTANTVVFVEQNEAFSNTSTTVVASLDAVLGPQADDLNKTYVMQSSPQMRALIRAGRELAGHPMDAAASPFQCDQPATISTFEACRPFGPLVTSNSTRAPSSNDLYPLD